mmetsp:Transcript_100894/g.284659  ORF Transcript_100894/g.284659 Transcript_100894/m.284659 type:complete len:241 (-) Transcript_100894:47-769(-)
MQSYGGAIVMEALLRTGIFQTGAAENELPVLRSVCLISTPASTALATEEARRLMRSVEIEFFAAPEDAARSFWFRHNCAMKPQPKCLADSYAHAFPGVGGRRWGALAGWEWQEGLAHGGWELRESKPLQGWAITRSEVAERYVEATDGAPFPSIREEHDFVTEKCVEAWRGVRDAAQQLFQEEVASGCEHNAHLENRDGFAAKIRLWLPGAEDVDERRSTGDEARGSMTIIRVSAFHQTA